jgi:hypothetical protein
MEDRKPVEGRDLETVTVDFIRAIRLFPEADRKRSILAIACFFGIGNHDLREIK